MTTTLSARAMASSRSWVTKTTAGRSGPTGAAARRHERPGLHVERAERLVHQQDPRLVDQASGPAPRACACRRRAGAGSGPRSRPGRPGAASRGPAAWPRPRLAPRKRGPAATLSSTDLPREDGVAAGTCSRRRGMPGHRLAVRRATSPRDGGSRPETSDSVVDLPQPVGPTTATNSPVGRRSGRGRGSRCSCRRPGVERLGDVPQLDGWRGLLAAGVLRRRVTCTVGAGSDRTAEQLVSVRPIAAIAEAFCAICSACWQRRRPAGIPGTCSTGPRTGGAKEADAETGQDVGLADPHGVLGDRHRDDRGRLRAVPALLTLARRDDQAVSSRRTAIAATRAAIPTVAREVAAPVTAGSVLPRWPSSSARDTGASYVVIIDLDGVRYSHPNPALIGSASRNPSWRSTATSARASTRAASDVGQRAGAASSTRRARIMGEVSVGILESEVGVQLSRRRCSTSPCTPRSRWPSASPPRCCSPGASSGSTFGLELARDRRAAAGARGDAARHPRGRGGRRRRAGSTSSTTRRGGCCGIDAARHGPSRTSLPGGGCADVLAGEVDGHDLVASPTSTCSWSTGCRSSWPAATPARW